MMKKLWKQPWSYKESFLVAFFLLVLGFTIELVTPQKGVHLPGFPMNMYLGLSFIVFLSFLWIFYSDHSIVKWLSSIPAAISSISLVTFMALLLGLTSQDDPAKDGIAEALGLTHVKNSWPMALSQLYVLTSLGLVVLRRATPLTMKSFGFFLNHFGLWLVIASASLGTGDLQRYKMNLLKGETIWYAYNDNHQPKELPFALRLNSFEKEEYPPKIAVYNAMTGEILRDGKKPVMTPLDTSKSILYLMNWEIDIIEYFESSAKTEEGSFVFAEGTGTPPAAFIKVRNLVTQELAEGWISCGSFTTEGEYLWLTPMTVMIMTVPEAKRYASTVTVYTRSNEPYDQLIEVNKPPKIEGWKLYQLSYDQSKGKWSDLSVIEVVKDPWLPIVYTGIFMLLAGALYIFWIGKNKKE